MMALAVEVKRLGEPYAQPYIWLSDAAEQMRRIYRMTAPVAPITRPTKIYSYFQKKPKSTSHAQFHTIEPVASNLS